MGFSLTREHASAEGDRDRISHWGRSSAGRALPWHGRGRGFESLRFHHSFPIRLTGRTPDSESEGGGSNPSLGSIQNIGVREADSFAFEANR